MLDLILAWARLDGAISIWVGVKFGVEADKAFILVGRSSADHKLQMLQRLYALEGQTDMVGTIKAIRRAYEARAKPRNIIAHSNCIGSRKSE